MFNFHPKRIKVREEDVRVGVHPIFTAFYLERVGGNLLSLSLYIRDTLESRRVSESGGDYRPHLTRPSAVSPL